MHVLILIIGKSHFKNQNITKDFLLNGAKKKNINRLIECHFCHFNIQFILKNAIIIFICNVSNFMKKVENKAVYSLNFKIQKSNIFYNTINITYSSKTIFQ